VVEEHPGLDTMAPLLPAAVVVLARRTPYKELLDVVVVVVEPTVEGFGGMGHPAGGRADTAQLGVAPVLLMVVMPAATHAVVAEEEVGGTLAPEDMEQGATVVVVGLVSSI
jgi:hypothetical protein